MAATYGNKRSFTSRWRQIMPACAGGGTPSISSPGHSTSPTMPLPSFDETFHTRASALATACLGTSLSGSEDRFEHGLHYLSALVARMAWKQIEDDRLLLPWPEHADGSR